MSSYLRFMLFVFLSLFKSRRRLAAEIVVLRHQVLVLKRKHRGRIKLSRLDRVILTWLSRAVPAVRNAIVIVKPETLLRWHRKGFRAFWRWKSGATLGRPSANQELKCLIHRMAHENPLWGAPRIHGELLKLGFKVAQSTVSKYLRRHSWPSGQTWKTFIETHKDAIAGIDLFIVPTIGFKLLYGIAILHLKRRELIWTNATLHPTADWIAQQLTEAFPWDEAPRHLIRDRDASYGAVFRRRLNSLGIRDHPTAPRSPWQNGYVERVIGSIRRECTDHTIVFGEAHLRRTLRSYAQYYSRARTHLSLAKDSPVHRPIQSHGAISSRPHLGGLHHEYTRMGYPQATAIVRAHKWNQQLISGKSITEIARQESVHRSYVGNTLPLAFLAPDITEAILDGRQPADLKVEQLLQSLPIAWVEQRRILGFSAKA